MGKYQQHLFNIYQTSVQRTLLDLCPCGHSWFQNVLYLLPQGQPLANPQLPRCLLRAWSAHFPESPRADAPDAVVRSDTHTPPPHAVCLPPISPSSSPGSVSWDHLQTNRLYLHLCFWESPHKATRYSVYKLHVHLHSFSQSFGRF